MTKLFLFISFLILPSLCIAEPLVISKGTLVEFAQTFVPNPSKSQTNTSMTGTVVFKKSPTTAELLAGIIDLTDVIYMMVRPTISSTYYYNTDTGKTITLDDITKNPIPIANNVTKITFSFGAGTAEVQCMTK